MQRTTILYRTLLYLKGLVIVSLLFSMQMEPSSASPIYNFGSEISKLVPVGYHQPIHDQELTATEENNSEDTFSELDFDLAPFELQVPTPQITHAALPVWHCLTHRSSLPLYLFYCNFRL